MNRETKGFLLTVGAVMTAAVIMNWFSAKKTAAQAPTAAQNS